MERKFNWRILSIFTFYKHKRQHATPPKDQDIPLPEELQTTEGAAITDTANLSSKCDENFSMLPWLTSETWL